MKIKKVVFTGQPMDMEAGQAMADRLPKGGGNFKALSALSGSVVALIEPI